MFEGLRFLGYKSFSSDGYSEISKIEYLNVFIGKNNCGKSSVLDVVEGLFGDGPWNDISLVPQKICCLMQIDEEKFKSVYGRYSSSILENYIGKPLWYEAIIKKNPYNNPRYVIEHSYDKKDNPDITYNGVNLNEYIRRFTNLNYTYSKISAERNILPESESSCIKVQSDGTGATNLIRKIINHRELNESIIEIELLDALNKIMGADAQFDSIRVQESEVGKDKSDTQWEVYLQEKNSKRFALSKMGSGLKTIILVLLNLIVIPKINKQTKYVYGFEELENNLHPALQRRLFEFIYDFAVENKIYIFLTTHSHVAINMFFDKEHTALYHVVKEDQFSNIKKIDNYLDKVEILDDLDVKASDLLQANGIIWVEGPSDRIYIKKWIEVFCGNELIEGRDFQFVYYGGRLLSHYSAEEQDELINVLLINRNSAIVIDCDKKSKSTPINKTKKRIQEEFARKNLFCWITKGKEIENYLIVNNINKSLGCLLDHQCGQYELFSKYIENVFGGFERKKVEFANKIKNDITAENIYDLEAEIRKLYCEIKMWNK